MKSVVSDSPDLAKMPTIHMCRLVAYMKLFLPVWIMVDGEGAIEAGELGDHVWGGVDEEGQEGRDIDNHLAVAVQQDLFQHCHCAGTVNE